MFAGRFKALILIASLGLMAFAGGCGSAPEKAAAAAPKGPQAVPVYVAKVAQTDMPLQVHAIGNVMPISTVQVKSQINASLDKVDFAEGQDVKKGQLLFVLDPRQIEADLAHAEGVLAKDEAQAANSKANAVRFQELFKQGVISQQQYDAQVAQANADQATVVADKAAIQNSKVQLSYTKIYSPINGRTGGLLVNQGNLVKANADTAMVTINQITPIYVQFALPEADLARVKQYMGANGRLKVQAVVVNDAAHPEIGDLTFIDNAVDPTTGTIKMKATFANNDRRLWPGNFVDVAMTLTTEHNVLSIPTSAVLNGQQGQYVYVVKADNSVENRTVSVERQQGNLLVISKGLNPGETVVTDGQVRLTPNVKVQITGEKQSNLNAEKTDTPAPRNGE